MAFMVLMGAGCGTLSITLDGQDTEEPEVDSTVLALQTEISILATLASTTSPQETVTPEATPSAQTPEASAEWSMDPIAGLFYRTDQALWQLDAEGNPQELMSLEVGMDGFQISPEGDRVLYSYRDDIWVADLTSGEQVNITQTDDRRESKPYWWPARPETILFNSAIGSETKGKLAAANLDGSAYKIIGDRAMFAPPASSEDGELIAFTTYYFDGSRSLDEAWLYHWDGELEQIEASAYNLGIDGFNSVSWVPGVKQLTWVATNNIGKATLVVIDPEENEGKVLVPNILGGCWPTSMPPIWSPNGGYFVIEAYCGEPAVTSAVVMKGNGTAGKHLYDGREYDTFPVWRPDGKMVAFQSGETISVSSEGDWTRVEEITPPGTILVGWSMVDS